MSWTPSSAGTHTLTARATDSCGIAATSAAVTVTINAATGDTQPPTVAFTAPASLADGLTGSLQITANASDNVGVASVEFQVDGIALTTDTSSPFAATVDTTQYASGQHVLRVRASDGAGNTSNWVSRTVRFGGSRAVPNGFTRNENFVTGLSSATAFTQLPDGRLLIAQQGGALLVRQANGTAIGTMLTASVDSQGERGLLGVTPHPNFASNGFIYIYYTTAQTARTTASAASRSAATPPGSELVLVNLPSLSSATNHNGGAPHFGSDGKLYAAVGDNANGANAPDLNAPLGKMLRFNDDGTIPGDNPFCTTQGDIKCAVWARGLRNPFTFAVRAERRPHPHQRRGRKHLGRDQRRRGGRELRLAIDRRPHQRERCHGPVVRVRPQQRSRHHRGILQRVRHHRRCVLPGRRAVPAGLPRSLLLHRPVHTGDRPHRPCQWQCRPTHSAACRALRWA